MDNQIQRKMRRFSVIALIAVAFTIIGILFASRMEWTESSVADIPFSTTPAPIPASVEIKESPFVEVADMVKPAVVSISAEVEESNRQFYDFFDRGPFREFFRPPSPKQMKPRKTHAGGTGIIISTDGYILTNNHLVGNASGITITLANGDEYEAEIAGTDPMTDVALLKIKLKLKSEQVAHLGDSDKIRIGQWAIAVGNPFGLDWTVTVGVISAKGRGGLNISGGGPDLQNFIQTDASINFGNSGGPLVNIYGEVIGINTAINSQGQGIGFAIPINMARRVAEQIINEGKVSHGYLGMLPSPLTNAKKDALGLDKDVRGIFVDQVENGTPAEEGGLNPGDVIVELEGQELNDVIQFRNLVASRKAGDTVEMKVIHEGKVKSLSFKLGDRAEYLASMPAGRANSDAWLGVRVKSLRSQKAREWNINEEKGVLVVDIDPDSPAEGNLQPGDIIIEIDRKPVENISDFQEISQDLKDRTRSILFRISRGGRKTFVVITP